jgi:ATP-dependent helicase/nuclease subunit A
VSVLVDEAARRTIREELDRTLVVEAAAGTGKTSELVQRIVAVVQSGRGRLSSIVAVTFTEKAAGEMKLRIRTELDRALLSCGERADVRERLTLALSELETAKLGTIHSLCAELLREHPIEAEVDPAFEVAEALETRLMQERAFDRWFERVLTDPPEGVRRVLARRAVDGRGSGARQQLIFAAQRLIETRDFDTPFRRDPLDREAAIDAMITTLQALAALYTQASAQSDPLRVALCELARRLARVEKLDHDVREAFLRVLVRERKVWGARRGRGEWFGSGVRREDVYARFIAAKAQLESCVLALDADLAACLFRELAPVVSAYELEKRAQGTLDFFDLLLATRDLLRDHDEVRRTLQGEITQLFVDEFQDTDPVQSELLLLLAADDPRERDPWKVRPVPGKLFVVGDPKQSIYRFRRADVSLYERVKRHLRAHGALLLELSTSFRSLPAIQSVVNGAFAPLMAGQSERGQASYVQLAPFRHARTSQPAVIALPAPSPYGGWGKITKKAVNGCLPDAVGAFVDWLVRKSGYVVQEGGRDVPLEARHVCLLFRRFRAYGEDITREYARALEARRIPHVLSGGRSFHAREEVVALRAVLHAIEWPDDALHVYATLRGPFVALSDEQLLAFKESVGHLHPLGPVPEVMPNEQREVAIVLALLAELHHKRNRRPVAETIALFLKSLRAHAGVAIWPTGEQALGNLLRLLDYARSYERPGRGTSFRGFVEWLAQHAELGETADAPVVEESSDGVRIMTIHAAKGLEFPVVVLCDPCAPVRPEFASRYIEPARKLWAQALCDAEPIELVEQRELVRDHDEAELVRLAYVATTRARELLVVPAVGEGRIDGWISLLDPVIYPPRERRRAPEPAQGVPRFAGDSVVMRALDATHGAEESVAPGAHRPDVGEHHVVWWDPYLLDLSRRAAGGVTQQDLLRADALGEGGRGLAEYDAFSARRAEVRVAGARPSLCSHTVTSLSAVLQGAALQIAVQEGEAERQVAEPLTTHAMEATAAAKLPEALRSDDAGVHFPFVDSALADATTRAVELLDSGVERRGRPSGKRFGTLVHALLQHVALQGGAGELEGLSRFLGRSVGANEQEMVRAAQDVQRALEHPLFERVRAAASRGELYREVPVTMCLEAAQVLEGTVDLAFREPTSTGTQLVVVDFKSDVELGDLTVYRRQLALYAALLERALGEPVVTALLRV